MFAFEQANTYRSAWRLRLQNATSNAGRGGGCAMGARRARSGHGGHRAQLRCRHCRDESCSGDACPAAAPAKLPTSSPAPQAWRPAHRSMAVTGQCRDISSCGVHVRHGRQDPIDRSDIAPRVRGKRSRLPSPMPWTRRSALGQARSPGTSPASSAVSNAESAMSRVYKRTPELSAMGSKAVIGFNRKADPLNADN